MISPNIDLKEFHPPYSDIVNIVKTIGQFESAIKDKAKEQLRLALQIPYRYNDSRYAESADLEEDINQGKWKIFVALKGLSKEAIDAEVEKHKEFLTRNGTWKGIHVLEHMVELGKDSYERMFIINERGYIN